MSLLLGLAIVKAHWFPFSMSHGEYAQLIIKTVAVWTGILFWVVVIGGYILPRVLKGTSVVIPEPGTFVLKILNAAGRALANGLFVLSATIVGTGALIYLALLYTRVTAPVPAPPSGSIVFPGTSLSSRLYVLNETTVTIYDREQRDSDGKLHAIQALFVSDAGRLESMAVTADERRIFVTDSKHGLVHILDRQRSAEEAHLYVGRTASPLALSSDGRKLYVGVIGPVPQIVVFDTIKLTRLTSIRDVGCPVSLYVPAARALLFVATQCGAPSDPMYVIDTRSDKTIAKVPGFAVGLKVVTSSDGAKAFVLSDQKLSTVRGYRDHRPLTTTMAIQASSLALSSDDQLLLIGTERGIVSFDAKNDKVCQFLPLEAAPSGMAVTADDWIYAQLPTRIFFGSRYALECH